MTAETSTVQLTYRPPYDWSGTLKFLKAWTLKETEWVVDNRYYRTVCLGKHIGWLCVRHIPENHALAVEFTHSLAPVLTVLLSRLRNLFDLDARPDLIAQHLSQDKLLKKMVNQKPGLRAPGAFDSFELAVRAILGQQVTVKTATTLACRFAETFGNSIDTPFHELTRLSPSPERIANTSVNDIAKLDIISARAKSIITLAQAYVSGKLPLDARSNPDDTIAQLLALPGIGPWTAHYIAMELSVGRTRFPRKTSSSAIIWAVSQLNKLTQCVPSLAAMTQLCNSTSMG